MTWHDFTRVFWRLLWIQGLLNRRGMQNLGLATALGPVAGKLADGDVNAFLYRHLSFFNCNPNFAPLIAGGLIRLEEERRAGRPVADADIEYFKKTLASPLAAMGDMLFLGSLKPLALTFACIFAMFKIPIGLLAVFLLYNLTIISCRLWGVYFGYTKGWELVDLFAGPKFQRVLSIVQGLGATVGGVLIGVLCQRFPQGGQPMLAIAIVLAGVTLFLLRRNVSASWIAIILFPTSALVALLFG